ncbi:MAG: hypothetical protein GXP27_05280 [Planctomycetes bacterium]|nr:hypothetical protein [Planctomycetota bacterium]
MMSHVALAILLGALHATPGDGCMLSKSASKAVKELRKALADPDTGIRLETVGLLFEQRHKLAAQLLRPALADPADVVRFTAAASPAVPLDEKVRSTLVEGLKFVGASEFETLTIRYGCASRLVSFGHEQGIRALSEACRSARGQSRLLLALTLSRIGDKRLKPCAEDLFRDKDKRHILIRICAAEALARMGDPRGRPYLLEVLAGENREDASFAAASLAALRDKSALPQVRGLLQWRGATTEKNWRWRVRAALSAALLGEEKAVGLLTSILSQTADPFVRACTMAELGYVGTEKEIGVLRKFLMSENGQERRAAAAAIVHILGRTAQRPERLPRAESRSLP